MSDDTEKTGDESAEVVGTAPEETTEQDTTAGKAGPRSEQTGSGFVRRHGAYLLAALLALAALVLLVVQPSNDSDDNVAVVDSRDTAQVVDAVTTGLEGAFAYDFRDPAKSEKVADGFFTGDAVDDYATLRDSVASLGSDQSLVYETDVTQVGVQSLSGSKAEVLAFIDQTSTRGTDGAVQEAPAQLVLDLVRTDGTWKVSDLQQL